MYKSIFCAIENLIIIKWSTYIKNIADLILFTNMGKKTMIAKSCPKCDSQVAVASKTCKCGHTFFVTRKNLDAPAPVRSTSPSDDVRRRTSRIRRGKPQYYDSQEYVKKKRKSPRKGANIDETYKRKSADSSVARKQRALRRAKKEPIRNENSSANGHSGTKMKHLKPSQLLRCKIILAEINRKMLSVTCRPSM